MQDRCKAGSARTGDEGESCEHSNRIHPHWFRPATTWATPQAGPFGDRDVPAAAEGLPAQRGACGGSYVRGVTHLGRKTGVPYQTVTMVQRYDEQTGEAMFCAGWGRKPTGTGICISTRR